MSYESRGEELQNLLEFLRVSRGFDFIGYKRLSLARRINRRMEDIGVKGYDGYVEYLELQERTQSLADSNLYLESIFASIQIGVIVLDRNLGVQLWSQKAEDLWGVRSDEAQGMSLFSLELGLPVEELRELLRRALRGDKDLRPVLLEAVNRRGKAISCRVSSAPLLRGKDGITGTVLMMEDWKEPVPISSVLDLSAAEQRTQESESRLRSIFDGALEGIALNLLDEGTYLDVNCAFERLSGFPREEILGRTPDDLALWVEAAERRAVLKRLRDEGMVENALIRIRRRDGAEIVCLFSAATLDVEGRRAVASFARDVTVERRTERELHELKQRMLERSRMAEIGAVVARVLHDVRNPLAAIQLNARGLLREITERTASPLGEYANDILTGVRRVEQILSGVSVFMRQRLPEPSSFDAAELVQQALVLAKPIAADRAVTLSSSVDGPLRLEADPIQLLRVLENLLRNAIDAVAEGSGAVQLGTSAPAPDQVRFSVVDDGPGIPDGFDPFALFQTTKPEGTGLGLAIAREIVESHGGTLTFERLTPYGTAFHLDIPVEPNTASVARLPPDSERH